MDGISVGKSRKGLLVPVYHDDVLVVCGICVTGNPFASDTSSLGMQPLDHSA